MTEAGPQAPAGATVGFLERRIGWIVTVASLVAFAAAVVLMVEKLMLIGDPDYVPTCSINPVLSCGSIMKSPQAEAFGLPNPLLGVVGFALFTVLGAATAMGAKPSRPTWIAAQMGATFAFGFVCWLIFQSLYRIEALCPYCMGVWVAVFVLFWYVTLFNFATSRIACPRRLRPVLDFALRYHAVILTAALLVVVALIGEAFWSYWRTLP